MHHHDDYSTDICGGDPLLDVIDKCLADAVWLETVLIEGITIDRALDACVTALQVITEMRERLTPPMPAETSLPLLEVA